jgi:hypothetical protein
VQISKALVNSKILFLIQKFFSSLSADRPCGPLGRWPSRPRWPLSSRGPNPALPAQLACVLMVCLRRYVFPFGSRLPSWPPPSRLSVKWARAVRFVFLPCWPTIATSSHCLRPPRAARPPTPHQAAPPSMALRLLPSAISPSPAPVCPSPGTIKGRGAPPGHHHTHLAINRLLPSPQRPTPLSASSTDRSSPSPGRVRPSAAPSCRR